MTILAIGPGKPKMCLQENLVDCADCGGLPPVQGLTRCTSVGEAQTINMTAGGHPYFS